MSKRTVPVSRVSIEPVSVEETAAFAAYVFAVNYGDRPGDALVLVRNVRTGERAIRIFYDEPGGQSAASRAICAVDALERSEGK